MSRTLAARPIIDIQNLCPRHQHFRSQFCFLRTLERNLHRLDEPLLVELHAINARDTMIAIALTQRTAVVNDVVNILAGHLNDRVVTRTSSHSWILSKNFSDPLERPKR